MKAARLRRDRGRTLWLHPARHRPIASRRPTATSPTSAPTRICRRSPSSTDRRSPPAQDHLRNHRDHRRDRVGDDRVLPRGDGQRGVVRHRRDLHLRHRVPVLRAADRDEDRPTARRQRHARRALRKRHRLHADRPAGAVRTPLRRHRRRRSAGRPGAGHADGLSAGHHLDHHRRGSRRLCSGLPGAVRSPPDGAVALWVRWRATSSARSAA